MLLYNADLSISFSRIPSVSIAIVHLLCADEHLELLFFVTDTVMLCVFYHSVTPECTEDEKLCGYTCIAKDSDPDNDCIPDGVS